MSGLSMKEKGVTNALPKLPGFDFPELNPRMSNARTQNLTYAKGGAAVKSHAQAPPPRSKEAAAFTDVALRLKFPEWDGNFHNRVLRFFGYFTEPVTESPVEKLRVRKIRVLYYLEDRTFLVTEVPPPNSGTRGGTMMNRAAHNDITLDMCRSGMTVVMRGQRMTLVDADPFTRELYDRCGVPYGDAVEYPPDQFEKLQAATSTQVRLGKDEDHIVMKRSLEMAAAAATGHYSLRPSAQERHAAQNFLKYGSQTLCFYAMWDRREFRINYSLAAATISVVEMMKPNSGRDPATTLIKAAKIPKEGAPLLKSIDTICPPREAGKITFITELDLSTGIVVTLLNRDFAIYDADEFTKRYYREVVGKELESYPKPGDESPTRATRAMDVPPYNGFGTDEDSLGSYKYLVLKPPKKDYAKYNKHINDVLRFKAELVDSAPEDIGRDFIVCYYLADDTMQVFEQAKRNSGHAGGKVFARAKLPGYTPESMRVGEVINVNGQRYRLTQTDQRTARFMAGESRQISDEEVQRCVVAIRSLLNQRYSRITEAFRRYARGKVGIAVEDLRQLMLDAEIPNVTDDLVFHIMAMVDEDGDGFVSYQEFVLGLMQHTEGSGVARVDPSKKTIAESGTDPSLYMQTHSQQQRRRFTDKVLKTFCEKLEARRAVLVDAFRMVTDKSLDGLVGTEEFQSVVMDLMGLNFTEDEMDALTERFFCHAHIPDWRSRRLSLQQFRRVMDEVL